MFRIFTEKIRKYAGIIIPAFLIIAPYQSVAQQEYSSYQTPPKAIVDIIDKSVDRQVIISNSGNHIIILQRKTYPSIYEINQPHLKLAGIKFYTENLNHSKSIAYSEITVKTIGNSKEMKLTGIPKDAKIAEVSFSPDESHIAFAVITNNAVELWIAHLNSLAARRISEHRLNNIYGRLYQWASDSKSILAKFEQENAQLPVKAAFYPAPIIMESIGKRSPHVSHQHLLKNIYDEVLFEHYFTTQLKMVYLTGPSVNYGKPGIIKNFDFSPDGTLVMVWNVSKPYSYHVPVDYFAYSVNIFDKYSALVKNIAKIPLADNLPVGFDAVITGPRDFQWRTDKPQTYVWVEAQDLGDPAARVSVRDIIYTQDVAENKKNKLSECYLRFHSINWGNDDIAIVTERWWKTKTERRVFIKPNTPSFRVNLWDRYYEDSYSDPGKFVTTKNEFNRNVLLLETNGNDLSNINIFSIAGGASNSGERPFLLKFNVKTKLTDTLFRSKNPFYEKPIYYNRNGKLIFTRESATDPANYFSTDLKHKKEQQVTNFPHPYPHLYGFIKKHIQYIRSTDSLKLTANIYLPENYTSSYEKLPVLMWVQPKEYKTFSSAERVKGSPYSFPEMSLKSPIFWVSQGFAVMEIDMPILGESNDFANDTFIEQAKDNAAAAINKIVESGIGDRKKIAIGGHGQGAYTVANLLAHTNLFSAGIAQSGVYNKTLTPFGFPSEERTYWEATDSYHKISPFSYSDRIKTPLLFIHGEDDENPETHSLQSERFYYALKGHGGTVRLIVLPLESHHYKAKESVLHTIWEMDNWLKIFVQKSKK